MIEPSFWVPAGGNPVPHPQGVALPSEGRRADSKGVRSLTVVYITARPNSMVEWFLDSLSPQINSWEKVNVIVIDSVTPEHSRPEKPASIYSLIFKKPKPTVWQGEHRITKEDWWAASNARNTGICLCKTEWIAFCDDRCVLLPTWLQSVREAMEGGYAVCGAYEKRHNMRVENGVIVHGGIVTGLDNRQRDAGPHNEARIVTGGHWYGCTNALPLEWALNVNGYEELLDSMSFEDIPFGMMLANNGYPIRYDPRMKMIEDRTSSELGPVMKRTDKGVSPHDKSHAALKRFGEVKSADNFGRNLRDVRAMLERGEEFPVPDPAFEWRDWYDGQLVREF